MIPYLYFILFNELRRKVIVCFVYIGRTVDQSAEFTYRFGRLEPMTSNSRCDAFITPYSL
jgi:hypothetical protein